MAAVGQAVGQLKPCLDVSRVTNYIFTGLEKEKNEAEGKRLDLEAKTEAAGAARHLLWSEFCLFFLWKSLME